MIELSYERGGMRNLDYIGATVLNFLGWSGRQMSVHPKQKQKFKTVAQI